MQEDQKKPKLYRDGVRCFQILPFLLNKSHFFRLAATAFEELKLEWVTHLKGTQVLLYPNAASTHIHKMICFPFSSYTFHGSKALLHGHFSKTQNVLKMVLKVFFFFHIPVKDIRSPGFFHVYYFTGY